MSREGSTKIPNRKRVSVLGCDHIVHIVKKISRFITSFSAKQLKVQVN